MFGYVRPGKACKTLHAKDKEKWEQLGKRKSETKKDRMKKKEKKKRYEVLLIKSIEICWIKGVNGLF